MKDPGGKLQLRQKLTLQSGEAWDPVQGGKTSLSPKRKEGEHDAS